MKQQSIEIDDIVAMRDYHVREAMKYDGMLEAARDILKRRKTTAAKVAKVRAAAAAPPKKHTKWSNAGKIERRKRVAALLAHFNTDTPQSLNGYGKGSAGLVAAGYLKRKGDGYVRTSKPLPEI
jgi:hypothetical protein